MAGYDDELVTEDSGENAPVAQDQPAGDDAAIGSQDLNTGDPGIDSAANDMPASNDPEQRKEERNWLQKLLDSAREAYGINAEAGINAEGGLAGQTDDLGDHEPAGLPTQAGGDEEHEPAGLPEQAKDESLVAKKKEDFTDPLSGLSMGEDKTPSKDPKDMGLGELVGAAGKKAVGSAVEGVRQASTAGAGQPAGPIQPGLERLLRSYVMGDGGEPKEARKAREDQLAGAVPDQNASRTKAAALKQAQETTPDKGVSTLQGYRKDYNDLKSAAGAAFDQGDKQGAARLYNEAQTNVGSGEHVTFVPTTKGMDAHIEMPDGKVTIAPLTDDQFRELMHKRVGEFDHIAERGIVQNLQDLVQTAGLTQGHESYTGGQQGVPTPQPRPAEAGQGTPAPLTGGAGRMQEEVNVRSTPGMATAGNKVPPGWSGGSTLRRDTSGGPPGRPVNYMKEGNMIRVLPEGTPYGPGGERAGMFRNQTGNMQRDAIAQDPRFEQRDREIKSREDIAGAREEGRRLASQDKNATQNKAIDTRSADKEKDRVANSEKLRAILGQKDRHLAYLQDKATNDRVSKDIGRDANAFLRDLNGKRQANPAYKPSDAEKQVEQQIVTRAQSYGDQAVRQHLQTMGSGGNGAPAAPGGNQNDTAPAGMKWIYGTNPQTGNPGRRLVPQ